MSAAEVFRASYQAESLSARIDAIEKFLVESDVLVDKAKKTSEMERIARLELRYRDVLFMKWSIRAEQASKVAGAAYANGAKWQNALQLADTVMQRWKEDVRSTAARTLEQTYRLGRKAAYRRALGKLKTLSYPLSERSPIQVRKAEEGEKDKEIPKLSFDLADEKAIEALIRQEFMWLGSFYEDVAPTVRDAIKPILEQGIGRIEAGKRIREVIESKFKDFRIPAGFRGPARYYFEGIAANAVTNARVQGKIASLARLGVTKYTLVNPMDERTTIICEHLHGTTYKVADAVDFLERLRGARSIEEYKSINPWLKQDQFLALHQKGPDALAKAGVMLPPFHFRCRTTVDIAEESMGFESLESP